MLLGCEATRPAWIRGRSGASRSARSRPADGCVVLRAPGPSPDLMKASEIVARLEEEGWVLARIREAIEFHLDGMREDGLPLPEPSSRVGYVDVPNAA